MPKYGPAFGMATNSSSSTSDIIISSSSSSHHMEMLQKLLYPLLSVQSQTGSSSNQVIGSGTLAHKGNFLSAFTAGKKRKKPWIVDSGASDHMTGDATIFDTYSSCPNNLTVRIADGSLSKVAGTGSVVLSRDLTLNSVLLVPNLDCNLLSISKLTKEKRCITNFSSTHCEFQDLDSGKTIGNAEECSGLYILKERHDPQEQPQMTVGSNSFSVSCQNNDSAIRLWHYRLGHPNVMYLKHLFPSLFNKNPKSFECEICQLSKQVRSHFPIQPYKESSPFSMIHSDIWGPSRIKNVTGTRWFISFIDDHTRLTWVFLMKEKSETSQIFKNFKNMIQTQFQSKIQILKSDNARDYFNSILGEFLAQEGIVHLSSCVDTPQQNGIAERKNRHLLEVARSLMFSMNVPKLFWGQAVLTAAYLINRMPSRVLKFQTPCQTLLKSFPTTRLISTVLPKIFGCSVFVHINQQHRSKLDPRSLKCIFLGYSSNQKGYKCYSPVTRKFYNSMDVTFFETQPYYPKNDIQGENSTQEYQFWDLESFSESPITTENHIPPESFNQPESIVDLWDKEHIQEETEKRALSQQTHEAEPGPNPSKLPGNNAPDGTVDSELENDILNMPIAWRKGVRSCTQHPIGNFISYDKLSPTFRTFTSSITEIQVPQNIQEAFKYPKWKAAVDEEVRALEKNGTWEITDLPRGKKPVGCKWIFTVKYKADGNVDRYKARLVAKGFTQSYGIDYQETFAPVAKLNTVRVLLSLAANLDWSLHQLDVKNAFLNGDLEEEVYMDIPAGLETTSNFNKVCRLRKSLYGLKQSPRAWFERFTKVVKGYGFVQCQSDHTLFVKHFPEGKLAIIIEFEIKDLGNLKYFLGMEIARSKKGIAVSQRKYVLDLLNETGMLGCKPAETPMDTTVKLEESDGSVPVDKGRYQRLVGKLIYLSHTRPDIGFSVSVVSQFMNNPTEKHMTAVIRILRYLKMTSGKGLFFQRTTNKEIEIFSDADWAGSVTDRRSTSGYCSFVWGNLVTWRSKKQSVVARSSAEAEFRAMAQGICEGIWLNRLLEELRVPLKHPMVLYCNNQVAISIAKNPVHHDRTKHVEIDRHFIKEKIEEGVFKVSYTPTNCQTADILTKALARVNFEDLTEKLGLINIYNAA
ncbi:Retrovirus-related Pol polyprotein from transposon TNT 1-94 [Vitis vinifera]|uniref:Retrovirus-related Pol polyprotein from transposon TNT 1-94 n=1 Tax=Vitis vinifera TaxID=29760 RepID=A0A438HV58_VITVI|nr:Retrovirus-related Pol polyprotein from transposon TNT 1-94 [Vitis vinifera]